MKVEIEISDQQIRTLLCSAFEGGSNHWYTNLRYELPKGIDISEFKEGGKRQPVDAYWHWSQLIPLVSGCALLLEDQEDGKTYRITRQDLENGLKILSQKYPWHITDLLSEMDDANTGDAFLQCVVFGDIR